MNSQAGDLFSNYRLIGPKPLGRGGFAEVWLGENTIDHSQAAVKILNLQLADKLQQDSFLNETRHLRQLDHKHIVRLLDCGIQGDRPYLILEYAPNGTLRQKHPQGSIVPIATIVQYVKQIAEGLQYAHDNNIIHRDVKPENMFLDMNNNILVGDFGIARTGYTLPHKLTQNIMGTISYMAPEQFEGYSGAKVSDQYTLAVMVYEWLCGNLPFRAKSPADIVKQQEVAPPSLINQVSGISPNVEQVIFKALSKDTNARFPRIQDFAEALERAVNNPYAPINLVFPNNPPVLGQTPAAPNFLANNSPANNPLPPINVPILGQMPAAPNFLANNTPAPANNPLPPINVPIFGQAPAAPNFLVNNPPTPANNLFVPINPPTPGQAPAAPNFLANNPPANNPFPPINSPINNPPPNNPPQPQLVLPNAGGHNPFNPTNSFDPLAGSNLYNSHTQYAHANVNPFDTTNLPSQSKSKKNTTKSKVRNQFFERQYWKQGKNWFFMYAGGLIDLLLAAALGFQVRPFVDFLLATFFFYTPTQDTAWYAAAVIFIFVFVIRLFCAAFKDRSLTFSLALLLVIHWFIGGFVLGNIWRTADPLEPIPPGIIGLLLGAIAFLWHLLYIQTKRKAPRF
jgi:serine/threonine protein kinase